jgi:hypothetical protein
VAGYMVTELLASAHERLKAIMRRKEELEPVVAGLLAEKLGTILLGGDVAPVQARLEGFYHPADAGRRSSPAASHAGTQWCPLKLGKLGHGSGVIAPSDVMQ